LLDTSHPNKILQAKLEAIYNLHQKKMDFRLDKGPYRDLLANLGNPHLSLPPTIHIAGTNGKGSTLAFLKSLLEAQGKTVHTYSSPHLIKFNERIVIAGQMIDDKTLEHYIDLIFEVNNGGALTFFEFTTALAFKVFADHEADYCLLETGLGGRLDCTNVIEQPLATIIAAIGYDHMDYLGDNICQIAAEKAGIMKEGVPCFIAPQAYAQVYDVFESHAVKLNCSLHKVERLEDLPPLGLAGEHQKDNASTALAAIAYPLNDMTKKALQNTYWPARMEKLSDTPEIWFDCGHNADGAKAIAQQLKSWTEKQPDRPIHLIIGLAADKEPDDFLAPLTPFCDSVICIDLMNARNPQTGLELKKRIAFEQDKFQMAKNCEEAIQVILRKSKSENPIILITGSLYLYEQATVFIKS
jgi:dihydrofolate synthase/folylpolyglutamate synthase